MSESVACVGSVAPFTYKATVFPRRLWPVVKFQDIARSLRVYARYVDYTACSRLGITRKEMLSKSRVKPRPLARQIAFAFARFGPVEQPGMSRIARLYHRDHTTVGYGIARLIMVAKYDARVCQMLHQIEHDLCIEGWRIEGVVGRILDAEKDLTTRGDGMWLRGSGV